MMLRQSAAERALTKQTKELGHRIDQLNWQINELQVAKNTLIETRDKIFEEINRSTAQRKKASESRKP